MAFLDQALVLSTAQAITVTANSTSIYDVTGLGSGVSTTNNLIVGINGVFYGDIGAGEGIAFPYAMFNVNTTFATSTSATLQIAVQAAPDGTGASSGTPGTYTTLTQTQAFAASVLTSTARPILLPIPPVAPGETLPRFYRFVYTVGTGSFTAGALTGSILINPPTSLLVSQYEANYLSA